MALTDEQRAMLQLLLEGGQGYDDIGSLLGISGDEVRARARAALGEMAGGDPDAQVAISDYLLGQADPIGRADAVRHLQGDPDASALAQRLVSQLRLLAPKAQLPEVPAARGRRWTPPAATPPPSPAAATEADAPPAPGPEPPAPSAPRRSLSARVSGALGRLGSGSPRGPRAAFALGTGLLLVLVVVLAVAGVFGGNDGDGCDTIDLAAARDAGVPAVELEAVGAGAEAECPPSGQITLARVDAQQGQQNQRNQQAQTPQIALQTNAVELEATGDEDVYVLWLYNSDDEAFPLGQQTVDEGGNLTGGVPLNAQALLVLPGFEQFRFSRVSSADAQQLQQELETQAGQGQRAQDTGAVAFVGEAVLAGQIAELGLDQILQQAQGQGGQGGGGGQGGQGAGGGAGQ